MGGHGKGIEIEEIYFLYCIRDSITYSAATCLVFFTLIKLIKWGLSFCRKKDSIYWSKLYDAAKMRSRRWVVFFMFFDSNLTKVTFYACNQISLLAHYDIETKLNNILALLLLFSFLLFGLVGIVLLRRYHKNSALNLITFAKETKRGFVLECVLLNSNRVLRAFAHSNLILIHTHKMIALIVTDAFMVICCIKKRRQFYGWVTFIGYSIYYGSFLMLDITVFAHYRFGGIWNEQIIEKLSTAIKFEILILLSTTVGKILLSLLRSIREIIEEFKASVMPEPNSENPKDDQKPDDEAEKEKNDKN